MELYLFHEALESIIIEIDSDSTSVPCQIVSLVHKTFHNCYYLLVRSTIVTSKTSKFANQNITGYF